MPSFSGGTGSADWSVSMCFLFCDWVWILCGIRGSSSQNGIRWSILIFGWNVPLSSNRSALLFVMVYGPSQLRSSFPPFLCWVLILPQYPLPHSQSGRSLWHLACFFFTFFFTMESNCSLSMTALETVNGAMMSSTELSTYSGNNSIFGLYTCTCSSAGK